MDYSDNEKYGSDLESVSPGLVSLAVEDVELGQGGLKRSLKDRHMQMIAIGGSIGANLSVGSGSALSSGGPESLVINFFIIGIILLLSFNALGELASEKGMEAARIEYSAQRRGEEGGDKGYVLHLFRHVRSWISEQSLGLLAKFFRLPGFPSTG
jgi:amino acid transporter